MKRSTMYVYTDIVHIHVFFTMVMCIFNELIVPVHAGVADYYKEYNMAALCGSVIDLDYERVLAGQLVFDDDVLPLGDTCTVGVLPHESYKYERIAYHVTDYNFVRETALIFSEGTADSIYTKSVDDIIEKREMGRITRPYHSERYETTMDTHDSQTETGRALVIHFAPGNSVGIHGTVFTIHFFTFYTVPCSSYGDIRCSAGRCVSEVFNCTTWYLFGMCAETVQHPGCLSDISPDVDNDDDDDESPVGLKAASITCGVLAILGFIYWLRRKYDGPSDDNVSVESTPCYEPESIPPLQIVPPASLDASAPAYDTLYIRAAEAEVSSGHTTGNGVIADDGNVARDQEILPPPSYDEVMSQEDFYRVTESSRQDT